MDFSLQQLSLVELATLFPQRDVSQSQYTFAEDALPPNHVFSRSVSLSEQGKALFWSMPYLMKDDTGCVIGACGFNSEPEGGEVDISCHVSPSYQNLGVAEEAVKQLLERAFSYAAQAGNELNKILALIPSDNIASKKVAQKIGFVLAYDEGKQTENAMAGLEKWCYYRH
ncbi:hypothetical protein MED121_21470 [Marinomonas sp. MED121]|uniref:GNAT family N-acetyltransferase n=1 Tax=Marinomonas sp. MED121 TaxID=314277 RepID=UPI000069082D|nr:GNAT family N-acetyltransferase [Marinomonas sp. MED121]EAQ64563.1 hypothetical protein MED121_21470 [Marinomonas sp. MED121]